MSSSDSDSDRPPSNGDSSSPLVILPPHPCYIVIPFNPEDPDDHISSIVQMFFHTKPLLKYFTMNDFHKNQKWHRYLEKLFVNMILQDCDKMPMLGTFEFTRGNDQSEAFMKDILDEGAQGLETPSERDAQQFLTQAMKYIIKEANNRPPNTAPKYDLLVKNSAQAWEFFSKFVESTFLSRLLTMQFEMKLSHRICGHQKLDWECLDQIQIDLDHVENGDKVYSIKEYLDMGCAEILGYDKCAQCGLEQDYTRSRTISRFSPYLIIHLNRLLPKGKIVRLVDIDERLEQGNRVYELVSVVMHKGPLPNNGFYWTVVRERSDYWVVLANTRDYIVKGIDNQLARQILQKFAFLMMYREVRDKEFVDDETGIDSGLVFSPSVKAQAVDKNVTAQMDHKHCGMRNYKNVCYSNAVFQSLYTCTRIRQYLLTYAGSGQYHRLLSELFTQMESQSRVGVHFPLVDPEVKVNAKFRSTRPEFTRGEMHDAQEYMTILLELVHQEANEASKNQRPKVQAEMATAEQAWTYHLTYDDNSYLSKMFVGQVESVLSCLKCGHSSKTWSSIWQLQLHLEEEDKKGKKAHNLMDCIDEFTSLETLKDDCAPFCSKCQSRQSFSKKQSFNRVPHYLLIHLKRFTATGAKIHRVVEILDHLKLAGQTFVLSSAICHQGSESVGHYYTIVRERDNKWIKLDDESIWQEMDNATAHDLLEDYAYMCVYKAVQTKDN